MTLSAAELLHLGKVFEHNGWKVEQGPRSPYPELFETTAKMLSRLEPDERELVFRLLSRYHWIQRRQYEDLFWNAWDNLEAAIGTKTCIHVVPLLKPNDEQPKSSGAVYYEYVVGNRDNLGRRIKAEFCCFANIEKAYGSATSPSHPPVLVLVDDYVGSGQTAVTSIKTINRSVYPRVVVLSIAAQSAAVPVVASAGAELVCGLQLNRGISDGEDDPPAMLAIMRKIETRLSVGRDDRLGRGKAEAIVTLVRTPNNTFPVFWTNKSAGGVPWNPPFPR